MKTEINGKTVYPLSIAQKELLYEEISLDKNSAFVNVLSFHIRVDEGFDADAMTKAFTTLVERNDALRLHIFKKGFSYYQYVADTVPETLPVEECGDREGFDRALAEYLKTHVKMTDECLYRAKIFRFGESGGGLAVILHHACCDGYSMGLMLSLLDKYYNSWKNGEAPAEEKVYSVTDFFKVEKEYKNKEGLKKDIAWWKAKYKAQRHYSMPAGYRSSDYSCDNDVIRISGDDYEKLSLICRESSCSVQSVLMALAAVTVGVLKKKNNFCFYSLCHGRATYPLKKTVGCMVSTVPIFFNIKDEITLKELFRDSYMDYLETMSHAHMPFSKHISMSMMQSLKNRFNFCHGWMQFSAMDYQKIISSLSFFADLTNKQLQCNQFYCGVLDVPAEKCVKIFLKYQIKCFSKEQIRHVMETYEKLIIAAANKPDISVGELKALAE